MKYERIVCSSSLCFFFWGGGADACKSSPKKPSSSSNVQKSISLPEHLALSPVSGLSSSEKNAEVSYLVTSSASSLVLQLTMIANLDNSLYFTKTLKTRDL